MYCLVVIEVVIGSGVCMNIKAFYLNEGLSSDNVVFAWYGLWLQRNVYVHLDTVRIWRNSYCSERHIYVHYISLKRFVLFVLCIFSCNQGRLVYKILKVRICLNSGLCVLGSFEWCYWYGKLFLCLSVWIYWWYMWFLYLCVWIWLIYIWGLENFVFDSA
jgi:hypothetical protein